MLHAVVVQLMAGGGAPLDLTNPTTMTALITAASNDPAIAANLRTLQRAMVHAGFWVLRDEWWHFVSEDVKSFAPIDVALAPGPKP